MLHIGLLLGGTSSERDISIASGMAVSAALKRIGHRVTPIDVGHDDLESAAGCDFAFIALHGGEGENGTIQRRLEELGVPYSGSGPIASRLAMDKELSKAEFLTHRVPTAPFEIAEKFDASYRLRRMARRMGWPLVVKPIDQGSSIGVGIVNRPEDADTALQGAFAHSRRVILERGIVGRELTVGVIGNRALPVCEVVSKRGFFDYDAKYDKDAGTEYIVDPKLPGPTAKMARHYARRAHHALRCHGYSRVDFMMDADGELWVLEVNTLPGMTRTSLLPKAAKHEGVGFDELVQELIDVSMEKRRRTVSDRHSRVVAA